MSKIGGILEMLLDYRSIEDEEENLDKKFICTYNLLVIVLRCSDQTMYEYDNL